MNWIQFLLFDIFLESLFVSGMMIYGWMGLQQKQAGSRIMVFGEVLLLGAGWTVGLMMILSLLKLYRGPFLWGVVLANYAFLFHARCRKDVLNFFSPPFQIKWGHVAFFLLLAIFIFRNMYFLIDVDSLSTYLFSQRLWLEAGTSLVGSATSDARIFATQFDAVPYSLGLAIFSDQTLFPQLVNLLWRVILVCLVFGYTRTRLNLWAALAAVMLIIFNDHFFYSGANRYVVLNSAVGAFLFAAVINFWEARETGQHQRFVLGLVFLTQLIINKFYAAYMGVFLFGFALFIHPDVRTLMNKVFHDKKSRVVFGGAIFFVSLWLLRNYLVTDNPVFPVFAGKLQSFGWTIAQEQYFMKVVGGLSVGKLLKFISFLFIWPGIQPAKYVLIAVLVFPVLVVIKAKTPNDQQRQATMYLAYWITVCVFLLVTLCLAAWQDPRAYRFLIGVYAFTAVLFLSTLLDRFFPIKHAIVKGAILILLALPGYSILYRGQVMQDIPTIKENINVLLNRMQMKDILAKHYPQLVKQRAALEKNKEKLPFSAWHVQHNSMAFFLPELPRITWFSTTVHWDDYESQDRIRQRLQERNIQWVLQPSAEEGLKFISVDAYVAMMKPFNRKPKKTLYDYSFPSELTTIHW